ncbi:MAG TPA: hypothetical protein DCR93_29265 [Cytophagales bacterium]|nr:hypothetical protein [Cytophagales bacterium]
MMVDGTNAMGPDNKPVQTDEDGFFSIDVPIGAHYISVYKDGHYFNQGVFPPQDPGAVDPIRHEFTEDITTLEFTDSTYVTVAGRVVGGEIELNKALGFELSKNNVGTAELEFTIQKKAYDLDTETEGVQHTYSVWTDPQTGEYEIQLIPEIWAISKDIRASGSNDYTILRSELSAVDLTNAPLAEEQDTHTYLNDANEEVTDTYTYDHKLSYMVEVNPVVNVYSKNDDNFPFASTVGESTFSYTVSDVEQTLDVALLGLQHPLFKTGATYEAHVYVYQEYSNPDYDTDGDGTADGWVDKVPVQGATVTITDNLTFNGPLATSGTTDEAGYYAYSFRAGVPNFSVDSNDPENSYTKTFEVHAQVGSIGYSWLPNGETFRGHIMGAKPLVGTDFLTAGPDQVDFVLRDPPGSNSYAWVEEGSSFSAAETWEFGYDTDQSFIYDVYKGLLVEAGGGLAGPVVSNQTIYKSEYGAEIARSVDNNGTYRRTVTFTERIETSSDPEDVGTMADLYIGKSQNYTMSETLNLVILEKAYCDAHAIPYFDTGGEYVLAQQNSFAIADVADPTYFKYTHRHLVENVIPDLVVQRSRVFNESGKYESNLPIDDEFYLMSNDHKGFVNPSVRTEVISESEGTYRTIGPSYTFSQTTPGEMDSVAWFNDQIEAWFNAIQINEAEKAFAKTRTNLSIDGSSGAYQSEISEEFSAEYNWNTARSMRLIWNGQFANITNNAGNGVRTTMNLDITGGYGGENEQTRSMTFGYRIDERNEGDYYSIDIKKPRGVSMFDRNHFVDNLPSGKSFVIQQSINAGIAVGVTGAVYGTNALVVTRGFAKFLGTTSANSDPFIAGLKFGTNLIPFAYEMGNVGRNVIETIDEANGVRTTRVSGFNVGSPVFSIKGGQTRCPYEPEETTTFLLDENNNLANIQLHTATLAREAPTITVEQAIVSNVPESEQAVFTLKLGNESASGTDIWYNLSIDETTNPHGAGLQIDGQGAEKSYLVPASGILKKTLTLAKGATGELAYDSIGIILHSACQFNPESSQEEIADTVYISARFLPECSDLNLGNVNQNWVLNDGDTHQMSLVVDGYDLNHSTLDRIDIKFQTLSGDPVVSKAWFKPNSTAYDSFTGERAFLTGSEFTHDWDVESLDDGPYIVFAQATCLDGSKTTTEYYQGTIDRELPQVFGTPTPANGVYGIGEDISITFNEDIATGLVTRENIELMSVLNGAALRDGVSLNFDGVDDQAEIPGVSFTEKSFTLEVRAKRGENREEVLFDWGSGDNTLKAWFDVAGDVHFQLGSTEIIQTPVYNVALPATVWHTWAFRYDHLLQQAAIAMDNELLGTTLPAAYVPNDVNTLILGTDGSDYFQGKINEVRIWSAYLSVGEMQTYATTLSGKEANLYGYWPLDEGYGNVALDKAGGRHLQVNSNWVLEPGGNSITLDGTTTDVVVVNGTKALATAKMDLTFEFWMKAALPTDTAALLANGYGDARDVSPQQQLSINLLDDGSLILMNNEVVYTLITENLADNEWHHVAVSIQRQGYVSAFLDGQVQSQASASDLGAFGGAEFALGGVATDASYTLFDHSFTGQLDEVRIWNSARSGKLISKYMHHRLHGDEAGLMAYLPFEQYIESVGVTNMVASLRDLAVEGSGADASLLGSAQHNLDAPAVQDARPEQAVSFTYTVSDRGIIITPDPMLATRLEGQEMTVSVSGIFDNYGNAMAATQDWVAYVQQNPLVWQEEAYSQSVDFGSAASFTVPMANLAGESVDFALENLPAWLSADVVGGTVDPASTQAVTFTVREGLNVGTYSQSINLASTAGYDEPLEITVKVTKEAPDWAVKTSLYEGSMTMVAQLAIEDVLSTDVEDKVSVWIGSELRGVANVEYLADMDAYFLFLTVNGNSEDEGSTLHFKAWDASLGNLHGSVTPSTLTYTGQSLLGSFDAPQLLNTTDAITTELALAAGWNWVSFNLASAALSDANVLLDGVGTAGDQLKGESLADPIDPANPTATTPLLLVRNATTWAQTTHAAFSPQRMYKIKLAEAATLTLEGTPFTVGTESIALRDGWNRIGFVPQTNMTLQEAVASFQPQAGDVIKSEDAFAMYSAAGWLGSLEIMEPGQGYMVYAQGGGSITYPSRSSLVAGRGLGETVDRKALLAQFEIDANAFENTESLVGTVVDAAALGLTGEEYLLAKVGDTYRGVATPTQVDGEVLYFLTIYGKANEAVSFALYQPETGEVLTLQEQIGFQANALQGSPSAPVSFTLAAESEGMAQTTLAIYPNPTEGQFQLRLAAGTQPVTVQLTDLTGRVLEARTLESVNGAYEVSAWDLNAYGSGVYLISIETGTEIQTRRVVKH